eukprot:9935690-Ditylum_brightwellii.AAC.1
MVIVKTYQRKKGGRAAHIVLYQHCPSINTIHDLVTATEVDLDLQKYKGKTRRANFETYITHQKKCYNVLNDLTRFRYNIMDDRSKVRILNKNIKIDTVDTVKAQIFADSKIQENYNSCTRLYKLFISQSKSMN